MFHHNVHPIQSTNPCSNAMPFIPNPLESVCNNTDTVLLSSHISSLPPLILPRPRWRRISPQKIRLTSMISILHWHRPLCLYLGLVILPDGRIGMIHGPGSRCLCGCLWRHVWKGRGNDIGRWRRRIGIPHLLGRKWRGRIILSRAGILI